MIRLLNLSKDFKDKSVLKDLNFVFPDQGLFVINGDNMSGKTTLFYILSLWDIQFKGTYELDGDNVLSMNAEERRNVQSKMGFVFSHANLASHLTVQENLTLGISGKNISLPFSGDPHRHPDTLSGGEEILLVLEREKHQNHTYLFLDEVTSALDDNHFKSVMAYLIELSKSRLILLNSHDERTSLYGNQLFLEKGTLHD
ncbi:MAG: ATP-binding cassette domain-containing protein [Bacilli bacterium]|jgi:ABC-type lipoprotein export system ATPase subunit|nr:ATP-binding cassette domain-containing protein [Bacilli bacterium]